MKTLVEVQSIDEKTPEGSKPEESYFNTYEKFSDVPETD